MFLKCRDIVLKGNGSPENGVTEVQQIRKNGGKQGLALIANQAISNTCITLLIT